VLEEQEQEEEVEKEKKKRKNRRRRRQILYSSINTDLYHFRFWSG
jgi:hypothetical protein